MNLDDPQRRGHCLRICVRDAAARQNRDAPGRALDVSAQRLEVVLDRRIRRAAVGQDALDANTGQVVDGVQAPSGRQRVEGHVKRNRQALVLGQPHQARSKLAVQAPLAQASKNHAVDAQPSRVEQVVLHDARLPGRILEVAAAGPHHAHDGRAARVAQLNRRANHPMRGRRSAHGQVVAQLDAPRPGRNGRLNALEVLGTKLTNQPGHSTHKAPPSTTADPARACTSRQNRRRL